MRRTWNEKRVPKTTTAGPKVNRQVFGNNSAAFPEKFLSFFKTMVWADSLPVYFWPHHYSWLLQFQAFNSIKFSFFFSMQELKQRSHSVLENWTIRTFALCFESLSRMTFTFRFWSKNCTSLSYLLLMKRKHQTIFNFCSFMNWTFTITFCFEMRSTGDLQVTFFFIW